MSPITKHVAASAVAGFLLLASGVVAIGYYRSSLAGTESAARGETWDPIKWRVRFVIRKARGGVPELSWSEIWQMMRRQGGFGLAGVVRDGRSLDGSVVNPYRTDPDLEDGSRLFGQHCATCHAANGSGWHGPPLNRPGLRHGDSDLAIYKVVRDGISGTGMAAVALSAKERWQVVGYVRQLQVHGQDPDKLLGPALKVQVDEGEVLRAGARTDEWLTYSGSLDGHRYTPLSQLTPANVSHLRIRWVSQFDTGGEHVESTPIVANGVIFVTEPPSSVIALDAITGRRIWKYSRDVPDGLPVCCGIVNRGVAILDHVLFLGSLDGYLVAIDANTGRMLWETRVDDASKGYTITVAPLVVNRSVIVGVAGGEYGIRGHLTAYDADTGQQLWRFFTIPEPGKPGSESWHGAAWRTGGGPTWVTGGYDPDLDLVYWGVGNPGPDYSGGVRPGDNLYTDCVIALHAKTGKLAWYFQFTPHDTHDWDSTQTPILADLSFQGRVRHVICWANRNGFYYVLDRATGEFLTGVPFADQNWTKGLDPDGRPIPPDAPEAQDSGQLTKPTAAGATNWQNAAYDAARNLVFVHATEGSSVFTESPQPKRGALGIYLGSGGSLIEPITTVVRALDPATGEKRWETIAANNQAFALGFSGLLATGGGLVLGASNGDVFALDSTTGKELWRVSLGGATLAPPISFTIDGQQVVAVSVGRAFFVFGL